MQIILALCLVISLNCELRLLQTISLNKRDDKPISIDYLASALYEVYDHWTQFLIAFKNTRDSQIKQILIQKGFEYFSSSSKFYIAKGIHENFFDSYIKEIAMKVKIPVKRIGSFKMVINESLLSEENEWEAYHTLFSTDQNGNTKFCSILVAKTEKKNVYDFVIADIQPEITLLPDIMVINQQVSVHGDLWKYEKDEMIKVPKSLTAEDITTMINFFQIIVFKGFAQQMGILLEFPKY